MTAIEQYLQEIPKVELHVHLEGAVRPETFLVLARRNKIEIPVLSVEEAKQWFTYRDFPHFIDIFVSISRSIRTREDYELVVYEFAEGMAQQNVRYAEVTFSPCTHGLSKQIPFDVYFGGLTRGRERAKRDFGVEINWIFDIVRDNAKGVGESEYADYTLSVAREGMRDGVVALGLGGYEVGRPPEWFESWFDKARALGLHSVPHAGETVGSESVWGAVRTLKAERIGHGVRAIEDPELVALLARERIPLEVSPTSNICLGVYPSYEQHPLVVLLKAGVPITINSDDPPLFNTTLAREVQLLHSAFKLELREIEEIVLNGVRYSFLSDERKREMEMEFLGEMERLRPR